MWSKNSAALSERSCHCLKAPPHRTGWRETFAGHRGLVGSAILRRLQAEGYSHLITRARAELDLTAQEPVSRKITRAAGRIKLGLQEKLIDFDDFLTKLHGESTCTGRVRCSVNRATAKSNDDLVFITHRIPYPPFKGEKSRSWNFLRRFVELGPVHLASFVDDPADLEHVSFLEELCESCLLLPLSPTARRIKSLRGLLTRNALTVQYYRDPRLSRWLRQIQHRHAPKRVYVQGSGVAEYCLDPSWGAARRVLDMQDIDSDKWRQYADRCVTPPSRWIYRRESKKLLEFERRAAATYDVTVFVSEAETRLFQQLAPDAAAVLCIRQGVDSVYFSPHDPPPSPFADDAVPIVFTGTMNYWPNVDAVRWFATEVLPAIRRDYPDATFNIVGARPTRDVQQLAQQPGVLVTGRVPDVRPYLAHARVVVAPLRIARGIQSKVLEAMSMARPVVVTPMALEGIQAKHGRELLCAEQPADLAKAVTSIFSGGHLEMGRLARELVINEYNWDASFALLQSALEPT